MKQLLTLSLLLVALWLNSCKKDHSPNTATSGYKIALVSGGGQSDTIGNTLKEDIVFKSTYNNDTISFGYIRFEVYNCDNILQTAETPIGKTAGFNLLLTIYRWRLNGFTGTQSLKAILLDSLKQPRDSVEVTAT